MGKARTVTSSTYYVRTSGRCASGTYLTSYAQCNAASRALQLNDPTVQNDNQPKGVSYDPKGCYYEGGVLKFNVGNKNTGACTSIDRCLCLRKAPAPTSSYYIRKSGRCAAGTHIRTYNECNAAARSLRLRDTISSNDNQSGGVGYDPPGCYYEGNQLKLNPGFKNRGSCSSSDNCVCRKTGKWTIRRSGKCPNGAVVTSYGECNAAAAQLRFPDRISENDRQPSGVSYDPTGCYYEGGRLKFNVGLRNRGSCTSIDTCLCRN